MKSEKRQKVNLTAPVNRSIIKVSSRRTNYPGKLDTLASHTDLNLQGDRVLIMRTCSIDSCYSKFYAKDLCKIHYTRQWTHGNPLYLGKEKTGKSRTSEYRTWEAMKHRCYNKDHNSYKYYGGRGIIICDRWKDSFLNFLKDMGEKPFPKMQIDRINNNGNYEPSNCRWVSQKENKRNMSSNKLNLKTAEEIRNLHKGGFIYKELAELYGVNHNTIGKVIRNQIWI